MPVYLYFILMSFFASLTCYTWKGLDRILYSFPIFLFLSFLVEGYNNYLSEHGRNNTLTYNVFMIFEFSYLIIFLIKTLRPYFSTRPLYVVLIVFCILSLLNFLFLQGFYMWNTYTYLFGILFIIVLGLMYFYALFQYTTSMNLLQNPTFWIVTGLLFYYICALPSFGLLNFFIKTASKYLSTLLYVTDFMNYLLYTVYTIAFLCKINIRKYFSPS